MSTTQSKNKAESFETMRQIDVLDSEPEDAYDNITRLAALICGTPIAAVSLVDSDRQWFKSVLGLGVREPSRKSAFCAHTILQEDVLVVPDATLDPRFADNSLVTDDPHIRFYAGAPMLTSDGYTLGSLCVIDQKARDLTADQKLALQLLAVQAASQIEANRRLAAQQRLIAERDLSEAERLRLAAIVESSADAIIGTSLDGTITSWNTGAERLYGYTAEEITGQQQSILVPEDETTVHANLLPTVLEQGQVEGLEFVRQRKDGTIIHVDVTLSVIRDAGSQVVGVSSVGRDISERKRAEAALERQHEFQQALLESLQEGIVACDVSGTLTLFNKASREFHGLPEQPLPAEQWAEHFDLYDADGLTPMRMENIPLFRALQGEIIRGAEMVIAPHNGIRRNILANGQAIYASEGQKIGAVATMHDVTQQRQMERELKRFAAIVDSTHDAILASTVDGTLVSWNKGAERLYGRPAEHVIGQHYSMLSPPDVENPSEATVRRVLRGEDVEPVEAARMRPDGSWVTLTLSFSPMRGAAGEVIGVVCVAHDITERQAMEQALRESEAQLHRLLDASFEGIAIAQDGALVEVSPAFAALFGYDAPEEMTGLIGTSLAAPESCEIVSRKITECDEAPYEAILLRRDGTMFHAELRGRMLQLGGRPARVTAVRDITAHKEAEAALKVQETNLQRANSILKAQQEAAPDGILIVDENRHIVGYNRRLCELWHTPDEIIHSLDDEKHLNYALSLMKQPEEFLARVLYLYDHPKESSHEEIELHDGRTLERYSGPVQSESGQDFGRVWYFRDITARKEAEERLRQSEARLAEAQRVAQVGSWDLDVTTGKVTWSQELFRLFGLDPAQGEPKLADAIALYHPEDAPMLEVLVSRAVQTGVGYEIDLRRAPNGEPTQWYHTVGTADTDASGQLVRLSGTLADITERKALEEELRANAERLHRSEAALRTVLESAPVVLYAADANGVVTLSEGTALTTLGLKPGETVGRSVFDFGAGPQAEGYTRRALAGEAVAYDAQHGDLWLHVALRPMFGAEGQPAGIIGVCFDVTERVVSEERFRVLFEQSSDAHMLVSESGIIDCNPAAAALLRYSDKAQLTGIHPSSLSPEFQPDGQSSHEKSPQMEALAREHGSHRFEWIHRKSDGEEFPTEITLTPVILSGQTAMLAVWHDLTERKRAERQAEDYRVILEYQKAELEQANADLAALAITDGLTGLLNHRAFQEKLAEEHHRATRYDEPLSLLLLDVDHFKQYNDAYGHPAGDDVLRGVARMLETSIRATDTAARYGGEEFVVVLPQTDAYGAGVIAERVRAAIADGPWSLRPVTVSIGICTLSLDTPTPANMITESDIALYRAKKDGRNRVTHHHDTGESSADAPPFTAGVA
jgi:diguanylate cyclase (GGDEF)-like protein/PAS domain S-box-containing protein